MAIDPSLTPNRSTQPVVAGWLKRHLSFLLVGLVGGVIGGMLAIFGVNDYFSLGRDRSRQVVLQESSAIIEVVNKLSPSVVNIATTTTVTNGLGRRVESDSGAGSGIIIKSDGLILTNKHVVPAGVSSITVTTVDGKDYKNARIVGRDPLNDIAFIKIDARDLSPADLGDSDQVVVGQRVVAIGNALGQYDHTVTSGIISGVGRPVAADNGLSEAERLKDVLQTDAAINPGNSGGPLVDVEGRVIGINTAVAGGAENVGFALPINQALADITSIERTGKLQKAWLGVRYVDLTPQLATQLKLAVSAGAYLTSGNAAAAIFADSPAAGVGLKAKDIITKVDGEAVTNKRSLATLIGRHLPGDTLRLTILRGQKEFEVSVKLAVLPS